VANGTRWRPSRWSCTNPRKLVALASEEGRHPRRDRARDRPPTTRYEREVLVWQLLRISYDAPRAGPSPSRRPPGWPRVESGENGPGRGVRRGPSLTTRQINLELRRPRLRRGASPRWTIRNPGAKHSLAVGILARLPDHHRGQPRLLRLRPHRRARDPQSPGGSAWSVGREHDVPGVVVIDKELRPR